MNSKELMPFSKLISLIERVDFGAKYIYERDHLIYSSKNNSTVVQKVNEIDRLLQMLLEA